MKQASYTVFAVIIASLPLFASAKTQPTVVLGVQASDTWEFNQATLNRPVGSETEKERIYDDKDRLSAFRVINNKIDQYKYGSDTNKLEKKDNPDDLAIWNMFVAVAGQKFAYANVLEYATFRISNEPTLAFVLREGKKDPAWALVVNANNSNIANKKWTRDMMVTLVHEYAHLETLAKSQMELKKDRKSCLKARSYFETSTGCAKKNSYLYAFYNKFWTPEDVQAAAKNGSVAFSAAHVGSFVTPYAASSPVEDIAESFTDFVLRKKPAGATVADQKIRFFYEYTELVSLRSEIRSRIGGYFQEGKLG